MAKYRVLALSYINNSLRQPGDVVDFDFVGRCPEHLEPLDAAPSAVASTDPIDQLAGHADLV